MSVNESDADTVWLSYGPDSESGELISRMRLPADAFRAIFEVDGAHLDGAERRMHEVWVVDDQSMD